MKRRLTHYLILLWAILFVSCERKGDGNTAYPPGDTLTTHSRLLTLIGHNGWTMAEIKNPWDSLVTPARFALVRQTTGEVELPQGVTRILVPVKSSAVFSSVHGGIIEHLGATSAISTVADARYFNAPEIRRGIAAGEIADAGPSTSPSVEKIIAASPDIILASPMEGADRGAVGTCGIPVIEMADYMESTPLGRAEWIKLIGLLYGKENEAKAHFDTVRNSYEHLALLAASSPERPKVLTEAVYSGVWYVPGGKSYKAAMFRDAGGNYPWADDTSTGSLPLGFADIFTRANDADIWLVTSYGPGMTVDKLVEQEPRVSHIKAVKNGEVWCADTQSTPMFDEFPFSPQLLLSDYIYIFHPSLRGRINTPNYFKKLD